MIALCYKAKKQKIWSTNGKHGIVERQANKGIEIRHIYREFNADADTLANKGADGLDDALNW